MNIPNYLSQDCCFFYCSKDNINQLRELEEFIPLNDLLDSSSVSSAYFNILGTYKGKEVIVI